MVMTVKPDMTKIWAATGATAVPPDAKIASGWGYEMMPFEWENWIQNRNDSMLSHINQRGIPEWDAASEYFANKSYVTGSNGLVYFCLVNSTNINPVTDGGSNWVRAFPSATGGGASGTWAISVSGNAATATQFATARTINSVSFNGTANIIVEPYVERDDATNAARYLSFVDSSTAGHQRLNMDLDLTYNPSTNTISTSVTGNSGTATKWATARSISITGDATWTTSIDGSANVTGVLTLANSGVTAGTYNNVATAVTPLTFDAKGRVTAAGAAVTITPAFSNVTGKPTTLAGYGITDATPSSHVGSTGAAHGVVTTSVAGFMSATDKTKLDGIATNANNYVHPTTDGSLHVPATGTTNLNKALVAGATAGVFSWQTLDLSFLPDAAFKKSVRAATTANITLSAPQTIDGIALVAGDRVLVKDQTTASQNGIYVVQAAAWTRPTDADTASKLAGATVNVDSGTSNGGLRFDTDFKTTDTLGTTNMSWARVVDTGMASSVAGSAHGTAAVGTSLSYARADHVHPSQRSFVGDISTTGQGRFTGWYVDGAGLTGLAVEAGVSAGQAELASYNRTLSAYGVLNLSGSVVNVTNGALQQAGNQVLHAGNYNSYSPTLTGVGASGTWGISVTGNSATATALATGRTIGMTGDVTWTSASFNGSANVTGTATLANSGVGAGTYKSVTVDVKGRVTAGTNPTTLAGYGITDAITRTSATGMAYLPSGTTAQRDASPAGPGIRFNSTTSKFEGYYGSTWGDIGGGGGAATGGGTDTVFFENDQAVTTNYTITAGKNAMSAGPITINSGITVTVPSGSTWAIV